MSFFDSARIIAKSISTLLVFVLVANLALTIALIDPQPARASLPVIDIASIAKSVAEFVATKAKWVYDKAVDVKTAAFEVWSQFKKSDGVVAEMVAGLLTVMMHQILAKITNDIVAWINGGGKGKIRVLQDPGKFLTDAVDEAAGVLAGAILNVDSSKLCDPSFFKFKVKAAFTGPYAQQKFDEKVSCTFTGMAEGLQKFKEDFTKGGWQSFIELSRKENNDIGILLTTAEEMNAIKSEKSAEATTKIGIGKGYLGMEKCTITQTPQRIAGMQTDRFVASGAAAQVAEATADPAAKAAELGMSLDDYLAVINSGVASTVFEYNGKDMDEVAKQMGKEHNEFKSWWESNGGKVECKTTTPAEMISDLANEAMKKPVKALEDAISAMTNKLGTGAGSVLKPYVLAIAGAGINLMLNKGYGLISNAITPQKKTRKTQRQITSSLQEHTMLAQSAGALTGSVTTFRSFLLKAMIDFSIFIDTAEEAIDRADVLGRIPINKVEAETRSARWYLTWNNSAAFSTDEDCPPGYKNTGVVHSCNTTVVDPNPARVFTDIPSKVFYDEAQWCGAFSQEIEIPVENQPTVVTTPISTLSVSAATCPAPIPGTSSSDCSSSPWVQYRNGGVTVMATRIIAYDDKQTDTEDRFIRQNIVGADSDNNGIPDGSIALTNPISFEETLVNKRSDENRDSIVSDIATTTTATATAGVRGLFEMNPKYSQQILNPVSGTTVTLPVPVGVAQAAIAGTPSGGGVIIGGYNQFGFSSRILNLATGGFIANLPIAIAGSAAVYYPPNGRTYIFGGFNSSGSHNTIWEFNPANNTVRTMSARLPSPATGISAAYFPPTGRIYLFGGNNNGTPSNQILEYNQATDSLIKKNAPLPSPLAFTSATTAGTGSAQRIYVLGGFDDLGFSSRAIFEYNPTIVDSSSAITRQAANIEPRGFLSAVRDGTNANLINIYGGQSEFRYLPFAERYDAQRDSIENLTLLTTPISKSASWATPTGPVLAGGIVPADVASDPESAKLFPQGDIYYIPAHIDSISVTTPFWQKYFSPTFDKATVSLLNNRSYFSYTDFTATIADKAITNIANTDGNLMWLSQPYPELYEKMQELQEKIRVIKGYNYPASGVKNYTSPLADQLGSSPDDDPFDNNPKNSSYTDRYDADGIIISEGYKGSIADVLTTYNNLTEAYQALFSGLADENALEGVDKDYTILSPEETNIKFALIGKRCPVLAPSATSSPDLLENCPKFGSEYNMARRFIFESDDTGASPTGLTTGFATNPFTGAKSSALAGLLNLDEMTTQLQVLPPDKNIIKLIRLRQLLEQLQVSPQPIPLPGKVGSALNPNPLTGVDLVQVSLPSYEHIQAYLNDATTKNLDIQTLITAYGYTNAKDAYPEISKQLDDILDDITNQVTDQLKEVFLKRIDERLEEAKVNAQHRLQRFIEYIRDINPIIKIEVEKQRGDQLSSFSGADVRQISSDTSLIQIDAEQIFTDDERKINELLSRSPLRLTNEERRGVIGSAIYKIKTLSTFLGIDITTPAFSAQISQYTDISGTTTEEYNANLDANVRMVLKDVFMYYAGIFNQTDQLLPLAKQNIVPSCGYDGIRAQRYCDLTVVLQSGSNVRIYKDARTKLEELKNDFSLMVTEISSVTEEFQTLISDVGTQRLELENYVKLLSSMEADYNKANACVGLPTTELWKIPSGTSAKLSTSIGTNFNGIITNSIISTALKFSVLPVLGTFIGAVWGWFSGNKKKKKAKQEAERRERERVKILNDCKAGVASFKKHLGQLADTFVCGKINPKYED